jgi:hypothetical protein
MGGACLVWRTLVLLLTMRGSFLSLPASCLANDFPHFLPPPPPPPPHAHAHALTHAHAHVHQVRPEDFCQSSEFSDAAVATTLLRVPADWFGAGLLIHPCMRLPGREGEFTLSVYADVEVNVQELVPTLYVWIPVGVLLRLGGGVGVSC